MTTTPTPTETVTPAISPERDGRSLLFALLFGALLAALLIFAAWLWLAQPTPATLTLEPPAPAATQTNPEPAIAPLSVEQPARSTAIQVVGAALINLNTATLAELETLPGIGPAKAQAIVDGRPYASIDALDAVSGIGPATIEELRALVTTE